MKKDKTLADARQMAGTVAARLLAENRWQGVSAQQRQRHNQQAAQAPRTDKRCFCGAHSMWRAANRYFDCCRKAGVITLNLKAAGSASEG